MKLQERKALLKRELPKLKGKYFCPCLSALIIVNKESIKETIFWASKSDKSTKLALELPKAIKEAKIYKTNLQPKAGKQTKKFNFSEIFILKSELDIGTAKITVGYKKSGKFIEYCITNFEKYK